MVRFYTFRKDWRFYRDHLTSVTYRAGGVYPLDSETLRAAREAGAIEEVKNGRSRNRTSSRRPDRAQG